VGSGWAKWYTRQLLESVGWLPILAGNGDEATLTDFAPVVGDICNKRIIKINTCADSCFAIAGVD